MMTKPCFVWVLLGLWGTHVLAKTNPNGCSDALATLGAVDISRLYTYSGKVDYTQTENAIMSNTALGDYYMCKEVLNREFCIYEISYPYGVGACVPNGCDSSNLHTTQTFTQLVNMSMSLTTQLLTTNCSSDPVLCGVLSNAMGYPTQMLMTFNATFPWSCGDYNQQDNISNGALGTLTIGFLLATLAVAALIKHVWVNVTNVPESEPPSVLRPLLQDAPRAKVNPSELMSTSSVTSTTSRLPDPDSTFGEKLLDCFNPAKNMASLLSTPSKSNIPFLDGLRVFSISWVVFGHQLLFLSSISGYSNEDKVLPPHGMMGSWTGQIVYSAEFAVDSFFFLSGFLVAAGLIAYLEKSKPRNASWIVMFVLHRFLRLTPAYMFALFFQWKVLPLMGSGPHWGWLLAANKSCEKYWWTNLLYINNIYPWKNDTGSECFGHAWYLANDFQFFLVSPLLVVPYVMRKSVGLALAVVITLASLVWVLVIVDYYKISAFISDGAVSGSYDKEFYVLPYMRIPPYFVGLLTAMLWDQKKTHIPKFKIGVVLNVILHVTSLTLLGLCCYGCVSVSQQAICQTKTSKDCGSYAIWSTGTRMLFTAWSKTAWVICLAVLTMLALNNQLCAPIRLLLCNFFMTVAARLSYSVYLIHISVISFFGAVNISHVYYHPYSFGQVFVGTLFVSFGAALALSMLVEKPLMNLESLLLADRNKSNKGI